MATTRQQKAWWKLAKDEEAWAPTGHALKDWLFGGQRIPVANALFDLAEYDGAIVSDLFSEDRYFADSEAFWALQSREVAALVERRRTEGWADVILHEVGEHWPSWQYVSTPKEEGGQLHITCTADGEVRLHAGYLDEKQARRRSRVTDAEPDGTAHCRPELTKAMQNYLDLHRHAAVRTALLDHPGMGLRLMLAHAIAGSPLWRVRPEPQRADTAAIADSLAAAPAQTRFAAERDAIRALLGLEPDEDTVVAGGADLPCRSSVFSPKRRWPSETVSPTLV